MGKRKVIKRNGVNGSICDIREFGSGSFTPPGGSFIPPGGSFIPPGGSFTPPGGSFIPPGGGFTLPSGGFTSPGGGWGTTSGGFVSPPSRGIVSGGEKGPGNRRRNRVRGHMAWAIVAILVISGVFCLCCDTESEILASTPVFDDTPIAITESTEDAENLIRVDSNGANEPADAEEAPLNEFWPEKNVPWQGGYCRRLLDAEEQRVYDQIATAVMSFSTSVSFYDVPVETIELAWSYVELDHPDFFWLDNSYSWYSLDAMVELSLKYTMSQRDAEIIKVQIESIRNELIAELVYASDYEKVKGVYEYLINNTAYDYAYDNQTLCDALLEGRAVCAGYTKSMQYLLQGLGIEALYVSGTMHNGEAHSWNVVKIEDAYYHVDATHGDPLFEDGTQVLSYNYLGLTTEEILRNRYIDSEYPIPVCTEDAYNYYHQENLYLYAYDEEAIYNILYRCVQEGKPCVFKVPDLQTLEEACYFLFEEGSIWEMIDNLNSALGTSLSACSYSKNENLFCLQIDLT